MAQGNVAYVILSRTTGDGGSSGPPSVVVSMVVLAPDDTVLVPSVENTAPIHYGDSGQDVREAAAAAVLAEAHDNYSVTVDHVEFITG